jgi:hypothetical protein
MTAISISGFYFYWREYFSKWLLFFSDFGLDFDFSLAGLWGNLLILKVGVAVLHRRLFFLIGILLRKFFNVSVVLLH